MARVPVRFRRVLAAMGEEARARICESSGSEHSPSSDATDLRDLVNSFIERDNGVERGGEEGEDAGEREGDRLESDDCDDSEVEESLRMSFCSGGDVERKIREEVENARRAIDNGSSPSSPEFKRSLMARLRQAGFDAGLCKSRWEKSGRIPAGSYEYIDVNVAGSRYIVEVCLAGDFEIARPTRRYASLLENFPAIFIGSVEELKKAVRLMCRAIRASMKAKDMHVPPWRRNGYMHAKWFGSYKRTINATPVRKGLDDVPVTQSIGFEPIPTISYSCRDDFSRHVVGERIGYLAAALNDGGGL